MAYPSQGEIELPLLRAIADCGGAAKPKAVYPLVAAAFPDLTLADQEQRLETSPSTRESLRRDSRNGDRSKPTRSALSVSTLCTDGS